MSALRTAMLLACLLLAGHAGVVRAQPAAPGAGAAQPPASTPAVAASAATPAPPTQAAGAHEGAHVEVSAAPHADESTVPPVAPAASTPAAPRAPAQSPELSSQPQPDPGAAEADADGFDVDVQLGFGVGAKRFERPLDDGTRQRLPDSAFAALDAGLRVHLPELGCMSLSAALRYRTSLGFRVEESPLFALTSAQDARVQRVELSARSLWRIVDGGWSPALGVELGVVIASFVPELHDRLTPKYALAGPVLRPVGRVEPFDWLALQVGPELGFIAIVDGSLGEDGVGEQGVSFGAEASARARLFEGLALELDYRASIALVESEGDAHDFEDAERFVTLGLVGEL